MDGAQRLRAVRRRDHPADAPAGRAAGLGDRVHHQGALRHPLEERQAAVAMAVEGDVLVDLVGDREPVVRPAELGDEPQIFLAQHRAGRVLGGVDDHRLDRRIGQGSPQLVAVQPPRSGASILAQGHEAGHEPEDRRLRRVQLVIWLHHHHAVARFEQRAERGRHALACPEHHRDLLLGVRPVAVARLRVVGDRVPQLREPERKGVLVELVARAAHLPEQLLHGTIERVGVRLPARVQEFAHRERFDAARSLLRAAEQRRDAAPHHVVGRRFIGEPLRQVHRAAGLREARHAPDDRLPDRRRLPHGEQPTMPEWLPVTTARRYGSRGSTDTSRPSGCR